MPADSCITATNQNDSIYGIIGDSITLEEVKSLNAVSPLPGQFRLIHDGKTINISYGDNYQYSWADLIEKGAYRIEVHVKIKGKYFPGSTQILFISINNFSK